MQRNSAAGIHGAVQPGEERAPAAAAPCSNTGEIDLVDVHHCTAEDELVQHIATPPVPCLPGRRGTGLFHFIDD